MNDLTSQHCYLVGCGSNMSPYIHCNPRHLPWYYIWFYCKVYISFEANIKVWVSRYEPFWQVYVQYFTQNWYLCDSIKTSCDNAVCREFFPTCSSLLADSSMLILNLYMLIIGLLLVNKTLIFLIGKQLFQTQETFWQSMPCKIFGFFIILN